MRPRRCCSTAWASTSRPAAQTAPSGCGREPPPPPPPHPTPLGHLWDNCQGSNTDERVYRLEQLSYSVCFVQVFSRRRLSGFGGLFYSWLNSHWSEFPSSPVQGVEKVASLCEQRDNQMLRALVVSCVTTRVVNTNVVDPLCLVSCKNIHLNLIYFCRKCTIFTKFYEFMLQKVLKFANYAEQCSFEKLCSFAPIMPKIMLAQSAKAYMCHWAGWSGLQRPMGRPRLSTAVRPWHSARSS